MKLSDYPLNPRWVCWMISRGEDPATFVVTKPGDEVPRVIDYDDPQRRLLPRSMVFSFWIRRHWKEWAAELGFKRDTMHDAHENAMLAGHTSAEFDEWLRKKVGAEA